MQRFRKKPIVIEAARFDGTRESAADVFEAFTIPGATFIPDDGVATGHLLIPTLEGAMTASAGDWIIRDVNGEHYPCKPDIFEKSYDTTWPAEATGKTLHNSDISGARVNVPDIKVVGNGDAFQLLCKASSEKEGWMKSTKAMYIPSIGCLVQVSTQQRNPDGSYAVAEALTFVPYAIIEADTNGGRKLTTRG